MGRISIGLDIGTRAVRLAEVNVGGQPSVTRFGRMLLPTGAVEHGEVMDPGAVGKTTAELWKRLGMNGHKSVHVGMANRRVVVRIIDLPAMRPWDRVWTNEEPDMPDSAGSWMRGPAVEPISATTPV